MSLQAVKMEVSQHIEEMTMKGLPRDEIRQRVAIGVANSLEKSFDMVRPLMDTVFDLIQYVKLAQNVIEAVNEVLLVRDYFPITIHELNNQVVVALEDYFEQDIEDIIEVFGS
ncbi:hypothetical protein E5Z46_18895 [Geobacillus kaustophilus NBRC 102445]|uniref:hypothetical protein n=1 Tax=Geobacillus kaustophilus TaxID=1462 RepID=UPI0010BE82C8|nr:hypothetical protein [Geobacillus kaustophilus]QCK84081.1 hypothetical protein E5Z46_18895 [Geobacillus kaustophilus NBRC 102445]QHB48435.1 hypothetical protein GBK1_28 [Geobacillus phage GBK1]